MDNVKGLLDDMVQMAIRVRREHGEVPAMFVLIPPGIRNPVCLPAIPGVDKGQMAEIIRRTAQKSGAKYVAWVGEAWVSTRTGVDGTAPSGDPERQEAIIVSLDGAGVQMIGMVPIHPDGTLGEPVVGLHGTGRMTNLSGKMAPEVEN